MRITAKAANRNTKYLHIVANAKIEKSSAENGKIVFSITSSCDPDIGKGEYVLRFELDSSEIGLLFETSMNIKAQMEIDKLTKNNNELLKDNRQLKRDVEDLIKHTNLPKPNIMGIRSIPKLPK